MAYFDSVSEFETLSPSLVCTGAQSFADSVTESKRFTDEPSVVITITTFLRRNHLKSISPQDVTTGSSVITQDCRNYEYNCIYSIAAVSTMPKRFKF